MAVWIGAYVALLIFLAQDQGQPEETASPALCWQWDPYTDETYWSECYENE